MPGQILQCDLVHVISLDVAAAIAHGLGKPGALPGLPHLAEEGVIHGFPKPVSLRKAPRRLDPADPFALQLFRGIDRHAAADGGTGAEPRENQQIVLDQAKRVADIEILQLAGKGRRFLRGLRTFGQMLQQHLLIGCHALVIVPAARLHGITFLCILLFALARQHDRTRHLQIAGIVEHAGVLPNHIEAQHRHVSQDVEILPPQVLGDPLAVQRQQALLHRGIFQIDRPEDHENAPAVLEAHPLCDPDEPQRAAKNVRKGFRVLQADRLVQHTARAQKEMVFLLMRRSRHVQVLVLVKAPGAHTAGGKHLALKIAETVFHIRTSKFHPFHAPLRTLYAFFLFP